MAELLAVCEPATGRIKPDYEELKRVLGEIHQRYGVRLRNVSQGRPARSTLMPVQDSDVIAHPDDVLAAIIDVLRSDPKDIYVVQALQQLTGQKLGPDASAWQMWWKKHSEQNR